MTPVRPKVKVTVLKTLFQKQHGMGYWESDCLELVGVVEKRVGKMLEEAGCRSLGVWR